ncbi:EspF repeat-containing protein [Paludisphaera borealis]
MCTPVSNGPAPSPGFVEEASRPAPDVAPRCWGC